VLIDLLTKKKKNIINLYFVELKNDKGRLQIVVVFVF